ncbi:hypothetical protein [Methylobacterium sp. SI9]|uniref:hypothetical protein n=1 Tax=Methylobacterium guangdongense TaxID=3138811 RepID=UPI00313C0D27
MTQVRNGVPTTTFTTPYWRSLGASTPMGDPTSPTYFEGNRGRGSVAAGFCRMRTAALKRMQAMRYTKTFDWLDARDVSLADEVRFLVRNGDATLAVQAHVTELVRRVEGGGVASVDVTIGVCVGTGTSAKTPVVDGAYAQSGYVSPAYTAANRGEYISADGTGPATFGGAGEREIEYALTATPLLEPVQARQLNNPNYAVLSVQLTNQADDQIALADSMIGRGQSSDTVAQDYRTRSRRTSRDRSSRSCRGPPTRCRSPSSSSGRIRRNRGSPRPTSSSGRARSTGPPTRRWARRRRRRSPCRPMTPSS